MKKTTLRALVAIAALAVAGTAMADFTFENPPYVVGDILGQDSWTDGITVSITATNPIAGSQSAVATDKSGEPGNDGTNLYAFRNITGLRTWADGTRISTLFRADNNGTAGGFFDFRFDTAAGYLGDITVNSHSSLANVDASGTVIGPISEGTTYQLVVEFNFTADTYDAFLQEVSPSNPSVVIGAVGSALNVPFGNSSSAADANTTTMLLLRAQNSGSSPGATMHYDNVLIESIDSSTVTSTNVMVQDAAGISFESRTGEVYRLQVSTNLPDNAWADMGAFVEGNGQTRMLFDPTGPFRQKGYRVVGNPALSTTVTMDIDLGADHGQNFGTLFTARDASGREVMGAGFPGVYNTMFRLDHHALQFYVRGAAADGDFDLSNLPPHGPDCGSYLFDLDGTLHAYSYVFERQVKAWDPGTGTWIPEPPPPSGLLEYGHGRTRLGNGILNFRDNYADYDGTQIIFAPAQGNFRLFYYAYGHLFFFHTVTGGGGFTDVYACPWLPSDVGPIDLGQAVTLRVSITGETPFAYGQFDGSVLTCSNHGGIYRFDGANWTVELAPTPSSFQVYSMVNFYDTLVMGQFPTGELYQWNGTLLTHLPGWPPRIPNVSASAREAQSTAIYGGDLYVGVWPWGELWRYDKDHNQWHSLNRVFTKPAPHVNPLHPYEAESIADGQVHNNWGQRLCSMAPLAADLMLSTSAKAPWLSTSAPPIIENDPAHLDEYRAILRLNRPGSLTTPINWEDQAIQLEFILAGNEMRIEQDGVLLDSVAVGPIPDPGTLSFTWGEGVYGDFSGTILQTSP
jgi:hypothetical protein